MSGSNQNGEPVNGDGRPADPAVEDILHGTDQTLSDTEQTLADGDQTAADTDQSLADDDQDASDQDQAASDEDLEDGGDPQVHDRTQQMREESTRKREVTADTRLRVAARRDLVAQARDAAAAARDAAADARDEAMRLRDLQLQADGAPRTGADVLLRAAEQRRKAAEHRVLAAGHRELAARDRAAAADDRREARDERVRARADRHALVRALVAAETDTLTGAQMRASGLSALGHEIDRCHRTGVSLVVIYIDVVGLKACNDEKGHAAGDELLRRVASSVREQIRSYDLLVRLGGDEFLCVMSQTTLADAHARFDRVTRSLSAETEPAAITSGFAELAPDDTAADLIARADAQMIEFRRDGRP